MGPFRLLACLLLFSLAPNLLAQEFGYNPFSDAQIQEILEMAGDDEVAKLGDVMIRTDRLRNAAKQGGTIPVTLWTDAILYYKFTASMNATMRNRFIEAFAEMSSRTPIVFIERSSEKNYVSIVLTNENSSYLGMIGGEQVLNIANNQPLGVVMHELGHALGMIHEHQRPDRDTYVDIIEENVDNEAGPWNIIRKYSATLEASEYDFGSMMHYHPASFSTGGNTIRAKPAYAAFAHLMGQRDSMTVLDAQTLAVTYDAEAIATPVFPGDGARNMLAAQTRLAWRSRPRHVAFQVQVAREDDYLRDKFAVTQLSETIDAASDDGRESVLLPGLDPSTTFYWRVKGLTETGEDRWSKSSKFQVEQVAPEAFWLFGAYPNPSGESATLIYELARDADVTLDVFDLSGRRVWGHSSSRQTNGTWRVPFPSSQFNAGVYLARFTGVPLVGPAETTRTNLVKLTVVR